MTGFEFHFAQPIWLLAAGLPVLIVLLAKRFPPLWQRIQGFAAGHLLPHLLLNVQHRQRRGWLLGYWTLLWLLGVLALAGPRWDYTEQEVFRPRASLLVLLDLSESMRVRDMAGGQSRLTRAVQEIEDLLTEQADIDIGLVVFAGIPHLVAPLSDDYNTLKYLLYDLEIDLLPVQGSRLGLAFTQAAAWLQAGIRDTQHVLLISDGDFSTEAFTAGLAAIRDLPAHLHTLGIGTLQGDLIPLAENKWQRDAQGEVVISKLNPTYLQQLATAGGGLYQTATFQTKDSATLLRTIRASVADQAQDSSQQKLWHERFYLPLALLMLLLLPWFRRQHSLST